VISRIDTRVDPATRAVTARAEFANPGGRIKPGMLLRVGVEQGTRESLAVPESALLFEGDSAFVYVAAPGGGGGGREGAGRGAPREGAAAPAGRRGAGGGLRAQRRPVEIGAREGGQVEIVAGLAPGDRIVADGVNRVNPNQPLRPAGSGGPRSGGGGARTPAP
jgi:membrane fusion protein (multidrug efflux system)